MSVSRTDGLKINGVAQTSKHTPNATNEITTLAKANPGGAAKVVDDDFASSISSIWTAEKGTWSVSSGQANVDTLTSAHGVFTPEATLGDGTLEVKVTIPTGVTGARAGVVFSHDGSSNFFAVVLDQTLGKVALYEFSGFGFGSALASKTVTITLGTQYTLKVFRDQRRIDVNVNSVNLTYDSSTDFGEGKVGLYGNKVDTKFDDFFFSRGDGAVNNVPRWDGTADISLDTGAGELQVNGATHGGNTHLLGFGDDDYIVQYDTNLNGWKTAVGLVRYVDANNHYRIELLDGDTIRLAKLEHGKRTEIATAAQSETGWMTVKVKLSGTSITVWLAGTQKINTTDATFSAGGFGLTGQQPKFKNIKIGHDNNANNNIDDVGDDIVYTDGFTSTSTTPIYDDNGNLTSGESFRYEFDAWNRLVTVKTQDDNLTIATYKYDALGRRIKKVVTNSGDLDGTTYFYYNNRWQMLESRDGSENLDTQVIYGTQYVDEIVRYEKQDYGTMFVFQDANWNVTSTVNYDAVPLDRLHTTPYGEPTFDAYTINGDYDGDGDLDSTDGSNLTTCKNGTQPVTGACRVFDFDNDGDVDTADETRFDELYSGSGTDITRQPARKTSANGFIYAHQGLMLDAETMSYQNRHRQYNPWQKRFMQRDPLYDLLIHNEQAGYNAYEYVNSRPLDSLDPSGEFGVIDFLIERAIERFIRNGLTCTLDETAMNQCISANCDQLGSGALEALQDARDACDRLADLFESACNQMCNTNSPACDNPVQNASCIFGCEVTAGGLHGICMGAYAVGLAALQIAQAACNDACIASSVSCTTYESE